MLPRPSFKQIEYKISNFKAPPESLKGGAFELKTLQKIAAGFGNATHFLKQISYILESSIWQRVYIYKSILKTPVSNSYEPPAARVSCFMGASRALAHEAKSSSSMAFESKSTFFRTFSSFPKRFSHSSHSQNTTKGMQHAKWNMNQPCFFQSFSRSLGTILLKNIQKKNCSQDQVPAGPEPLGLPSHLMLQGLFRRSSHIDELDTNSIDYCWSCTNSPSAYSRYKFSHRLQFLGALMQFCWATLDPQTHKSFLDTLRIRRIFIWKFSLHHLKLMARVLLSAAWHGIATTGAAAALAARHCCNSKTPQFHCSPCF